MWGRSSKEVIPLYSRIASSLRSKILSGQYEPGSRLMSEEQLAEHFGVSRITVRESLSRLEKEGLIRRSRGRGTFVSGEIPEEKPFICTSLLDIVRTVESSEIAPLGIRTTKVGRTTIARELRAFFGLTNEDSVAQIHRVLIRNGKPLHLFENFMRPELASHITEKDIVEKKAVIRILQEKIGLKIGRGEMYLEAMPADSDVAGILGCQIYDPFVRIQVFLYFISGEPFEIVNYYMRAEHFRFKIDLDTNDLGVDAPLKIMGGRKFD